MKDKFQILFFFQPLYQIVIIMHNVLSTSVQTDMFKLFFFHVLVICRMSSGGCSIPSQSCSSNSPHLPSLSLSIKSERSSPEHMSSPTSPPLHHLRQHSPMSNPDLARHTPPETHPANGTKAFPKGSYHQDGEEGGQSLRQLEMSDGWQR